MTNIQELQGHKWIIGKNDDPNLRAPVTLFKSSGKYYTLEAWRIPVGANGPYDMNKSPDFRRIGSGAVLVQSEPEFGDGLDDAIGWGYPFLFNDIGKQE